jgi:hypothetical protein
MRSSSRPFIPTRDRCTTGAAQPVFHASTSLPELPAAWIEHLTGGEVAGEVDFDAAAVDEVLTAGEACRLMRSKLDGYRRRIDEVGHHGALIAAALAIVASGQQGHDGAAAALDQLWEEFSADVDREEGSTRREYERAVETAIGKVLEEPYEGRRACCPVAFTASEDDAFWNSRETLATIRQFARARLAAPWSVLGCVLARIVAATDYDVCLPPIVGFKASLNFFLALVGGSSAGKGISMGVARDAVQIEQPAVKLQVGSGEGLIHAFAVAAKDKDSKQWTRPAHPLECALRRC